MVFYQVYIWGYYPILNSFKHGFKQKITYIKYIYPSIICFFFKLKLFYFYNKKKSQQLAYETLDY
jgi:hypothetical protein